MLNEDELVVIICDLYEKFTKRLTGSKTYKFKINEKRYKQILTFVSYLLKHLKCVEEDFIKQYLQFAFGKYSGREGFYGGKNQFTMNWIISVKLLREFIKTDKCKKWGYERRFNKTAVGKVKIRTINQSKEETHQRTTLIINTNNFEEHEKARFLNTNKGQLWCVDFTTLYNPESSNCKKCKFQESCKDTLKQNYIQIHNKRLCKTK